MTTAVDKVQKICAHPSRAIDSTLKTYVTYEDLCHRQDAQDRPFQEALYDNIPDCVQYLRNCICCEDMPLYKALLRQALRRFMAFIEHRVRSIYLQDLLIIIIAMHGNINVRDAVLVGLLDDTHTMYDTQNVLELACNKHTGCVVNKLRNFLEINFSENSPVGDEASGRDRCAMLITMCGFVRTTPELSVQIYAILAYVSWWYQLPRIQAYADCALSIDPTCNLANIIKRVDSYNITRACYQH